MANREKLRKLRRLSSSERRLLVSAFFLLFVTQFSLRVLSFNHVRGLVDSLLRKDYSPRLEFEETQTVHLVTWAVLVASRNLPVSTDCLSQALATHILLSWKRIPSELNIGVAHSETGDFEAHAWVVFGGRVVMGYLDDLDRFKPLSQSEGSIF
jgi:hypothetical protein